MEEQLSITEFAAGEIVLDDEEARARIVFGSPWVSSAGRSTTAMSIDIQTSSTRRKFIETAGKLAAVSALANVAIPHVYAAGTDLIQIRKIDKSS